MGILTSTWDQRGGVIRRVRIFHAERERSDKEVGRGSMGFPDSDLSSTFDCASVELFFCFVFFKHETWAERGMKTCLGFFCVGALFVKRYTYGRFDSWGLPALQI